MKLVLPKLWYGISEICDRWECKKDDILHMSEIGKLALYINWEEMERSSDSWSSSEYFFVHRPKYSSDYPAADLVPNLKFIKEEILDWSGREKYHPVGDSPLTRLAHICPQLLEKLIDNHFVVLDTARVGRKTNSFLQPQSCNTGLFLQDFELVCQFSEGDKTLHIDQIIIPASEVERFEAANAGPLQERPVEDSKKKDSSEVRQGLYTTDLLNVLTESMNAIFPEDRKIDPKKEIAVEEIIKLGQTKDVYVSKNIAEAIFTIIKPENHDPRKRRGD